MAFRRASGILLHPTSLPSKGGIGDLGPAAFDFVDFLHNAKQSLWQVLPLSPTGLGNSPYSAISAFAGNPLLISLERLAEHGWLSKEEADSLEGPSGDIHFSQVSKRKLLRLRKAAKIFLTKQEDEFGEHQRFEAFCKDNAWWLDDYVFFNCMRQRFGDKSWNQWSPEIAQRHPDAMHHVGELMFGKLQVERALQFAFWEQWRALHSYAKQKGVSIIGDVAIFVNYDSADVWRNPDLFYLDTKLEPTVVSGVPPDAFSASGQRWGNPLYKWDVLKSRGYGWWIQRMKWALTACDYVRLDHFRGFEQYWEIPANEPTAIHGKWVDGPKDDFFRALKSALGDLPIIAEDLGIITPPVEALRSRVGIPGMKVLQFGFGDKGAHIYLPHRYERDSVAYTGTHDNDTSTGWWHSLTGAERKNVLAYIGEHKDGIHWGMIRAVFASHANFALAPLQDLLGMGSEARMNTPSRTDDNWGWRFHEGALTKELAKKLALITEVSDRAADGKS